MSSSHDENRRAELNGTEPAGEDLVPAMAQHDAIYDPGPSFLEFDRPTVRLAELPAWLQRFAASAGDPVLSRRSPSRPPEWWVGRFRRGLRDARS